MEREVRSFEDLKCWQACRELRVFVSKEVVPRFPAEEKYLLRSQVLDSSRSTTANIAEGYGRYHYMDNAKFCSNSRGSVCETLDHLITAHDEGYISDEQLNAGRQHVADATRLINGYIRYLRSKGQNKGGQVREDHEPYGEDCPYIDNPQIAYSQSEIPNPE